MELAQELQKIGLSDKEARVYLANLELGQSSVQNIGKKAGVNRATTYVVLDSLIKKGLCSTFLQGKKTFYVSSDPELLPSLFEIQKKEIEEKEKYFVSLLPHFKLINNQEADKPVVKFFEGKEGLLNCYNEFVLTYNRNTDKHGKAFVVYNRNFVDGFFTKKDREQFRQFRAKRNLFVNAIYTMDGGVMEDTADGKRIKVSSKEFDMAADIGIHHESIRILIFGKKPSAILIRNSDVAKTLIALFKLAWEAAQAKNKKEK